MKFSPEHIDSLLEVSQTLMKRKEAKGVLEDLLDIAMDTLKAERGFLVIQSDQDEEPILRSARNIDIGRLSETSGISFSIIDEVIISKQPILTKNASLDPRYQGQDSIRIHGIRSVACVPLLKENLSIGALYVDSRIFHDLFTVETINYLTIVASFAALALDHALSFEKLEEQNRFYAEEFSRYQGFEGIVGTSAALTRIFDLMSRMAPSHLPILIMGESGTGKELVARAVHNNSPCREKPFFALYCGNIPENLLESELFGHVKGAFTGAFETKKGLLELADGGTFLLDEVADIPINLQAKLLRFLQEGEIKSVGDNMIRKVNVRILAASNKNIKEKVENGSFREDLYYRLNVLSLEIPPLRERIEDIPLLALHFLKKHTELSGKSPVGISKKALKLLQLYDWPGNVRELENVIARAVVMCPGDKIDEDSIVLDYTDNGFSGRRTYSGLELRTAIKKHVQKVLKLTNGNRSEAKRLLKVSRTYLYT
ncbi:MAG: sigma 54-interacting transcriptional regulator, partial [FCB group bacterium]|nr:sigma 54-interacting transcriptional regulator [FCB group bacterium]